MRYVHVKAADAKIDVYLEASRVTNLTNLFIQAFDKRFPEDKRDKAKKKLKTLRQDNVLDLLIDGFTCRGKLVPALFHNEIVDHWRKIQTVGWGLLQCPKDDWIELWTQEYGYRLTENHIDQEKVHIVEEQE